MKKTILSICISLCSIVFSFCQETLTLDLAFEKANYPIFPSSRKWGRNSTEDLKVSTSFMKNNFNEESLSYDVVGFNHDEEKWITRGTAEYEFSIYEAWLSKQCMCFVIGRTGYEGDMDAEPYQVFLYITDLHGKLLNKTRIFSESEHGWQYYLDYVITSENTFILFKYGLNDDNYTYVNYNKNYNNGDYIESCSQIIDKTKPWGKVDICEYSIKSDGSIEKGKCSTVLTKETNEGSRYRFSQMDDDPMLKYKK